eukprot:TRINITY_DN112365_c0_g1_i1.p1 TRINITY_DN112365_c0_g1~~TRINITY_DN112365_c0_g1_i1.p1  ORF type:complete len:277 (-),score=28.80 TRINITY_DN112365_c0_g1_i1:57-800(-)
MSAFLTVATPGITSAVQQAFGTGSSLPCQGFHTSPHSVKSEADVLMPRRPTFFRFRDDDSLAFAALAAAVVAVSSRPSRHCHQRRAATASEPERPVGLLGKMRRKLPKAPSKEELKKYGTGMVFSYSFVGTLNMCLMVAISWPIFILRNGESPLLFSPFTLNPKYIVYLTAVYFSYGSVCTPFLLAAAIAFAPPCTWILNTLQDRLKCPRWLAFSMLSAVMALGFCVFMVAAIALSCAAFRTPIWVR